MLYTPWSVGAVFRVTEQDHALYAMVCGCSVQSDRARPCSVHLCRCVCVCVGVVSRLTEQDHALYIMVC